MKKYIYFIALIPFFAFAQAGELEVGEHTISYDSATTSEAGTLYYSGDTLVASQHPTTILVYENEQVVLEAHDTNADGELDTFVQLDTEEAIMNVTGEGAEALARPTAISLNELMSEDTDETGTLDDLVTNLDSITIPRYHNYTLYGFVIILIGGGFWWYRRQKRS